MTVVDQSVLLREVELLGRERVQARIDVGAVLGHDQHLVGILRVEPVEDALEARDVLFVPSLVEIPALDHRDLRQVGGGVPLRGVVEGDHRVARGVLAAHGLLQRAGYVFDGLVILFRAGLVGVGRAQQRLVHVGPDHHRGVVEVLTDHLADHSHRIFEEPVALGDGIDHRNFDRGDDAQPVAHLHHHGVLRVVRHAQEVAAHLFDETHVAFVHLVGQRPSAAQVVLVAARADEFARTAVEREALVGIEREPPQAQRVGNLVQHAAVLVHDARQHAVEVRFVDVPQPGRRDRDAPAELFCNASGGDFRGVFRAGGLAPVGRDDAVLDAHPGGFRTVVGHQRPHLDRGPFSRDFGGREVDARRCEVGRRHVHLVGHQQAHVAVDAAEEGEVGGQGRNVGIVGVVHLCGEEVFAARDDVFRDVEHEARVAARVLPGVMAVDVEPHHLVGPLEAEVDLLRGGVGRQDDPLAVPCRAAVEARNVVDGVLGVPRVGDVHHLPCRVVGRGQEGVVGRAFRETPGVVDCVFDPCRGRSGGQEQRQAENDSDVFHRFSVDWNLHSRGSPV